MMMILNSVYRGRPNIGNVATRWCTYTDDPRGGACHVFQSSVLNDNLRVQWATDMSARINSCNLRVLYYILFC